MRYSAAEKRETLQLVEHSDLSVKKTLAELGVPRSSLKKTGWRVWKPNLLRKSASGTASRIVCENRWWSWLWNTRTNLPGSWRGSSRIKTGISSMNTQDVQDTLEAALEKAGIEQVKVRHKPRLLSDNGPCYLSRDLKAFLEDRQLQHIRSAPYPPMTQVKSSVTIAQ